MKTELLLIKRNPILWRLKSAYIPGWPEDRQSVAAQIIVSKKKERRLRKEKLIWTVNETYFILFKYADWFMLKKKSIWLPGRCPHGKRNSSVNVKSIFQREKANHRDAKHLHHGHSQCLELLPTTQKGRWAGTSEFSQFWWVGNYGCIPNMLRADL